MYCGKAEAFPLHFSRQLRDFERISVSLLFLNGLSGYFPGFGLFGFPLFSGEADGVVPLSRQDRHSPDSIYVMKRKRKSFCRPAIFMVEKIPLPAAKGEELNRPPHFQVFSPAGA